MPRFSTKPYHINANLPHKCQYCTRSFSRECHLARHNRVHYTKYSSLIANGVLFMFT